MMKIKIGNVEVETDNINDVKELIRSYGIMPVTKIAKPVDVVDRPKRKYKKRKGRGKWSKTEDDLIIKLYKDVKAKEIVKRIALYGGKKKRSEDAVRLRARKLGVFKWKKKVKE